MGFFFTCSWQTPNKEFLNIKPTLSWKGSQRALYLLEMHHKLVSNKWPHGYQFLINNLLVLTLEEKSCILPNFFLMFRGFCFNNLSCQNYTSFEIMCVTFELWTASSYLGVELVWVLSYGRFLSSSKSSGQPKYRKCVRPEKLWKKLSNGRGKSDGVRQEGDWLLPSPRIF